VSSEHSNIFSPVILHQNVLLATMSPRYNGFQAISFDGGTSYEANEPLIVAAGDTEEEQEDRRLEKKTFSRLKFSALLLGLLAGFFIHFSILETNLWVITIWDEDLVTKSKTNFVVFSLLWSFFFSAVMAIINLRFLNSMVTITYSAAGGRSKDVLEEMVWRMECLFGAGFCIASTMTGVLWGMRTQTEFSLLMLVVALVWCKIVVMCFTTDADSKPESSRRSTAEETMTAGV
jgi:hypothetical protein